MKPSPRIPEACIRKSPSIAYCGGEISSRDFAFTDPEHAVKNYEHGERLRACAGCVSAVRWERKL